MRPADPSHLSHARLTAEGAARRGRRRGRAAARRLPARRGTWAPATSMAEYHYAHTATLLDDGRGARRRRTPAADRPSSTTRPPTPGPPAGDHEGRALLPHRHQAERRAGARGRRAQLAQQLRPERRDLQPGHRALDRHEGHARAQRSSHTATGSRTARSSSPAAATTAAPWPAPSCTTRSPARGPLLPEHEPTRAPGTPRTQPRQRSGAGRRRRLGPGVRPGHPQVDGHRADAGGPHLRRGRALGGRKVLLVGGYDESARRPPPPRSTTRPPTPGRPPTGSRHRPRRVRAHPPRRRPGARHRRAEAGTHRRGLRPVHRARGSSSRTWSIGASTTSSTVLDDGRVLVAGGFSEDFFDYTNTAELFDPRLTVRPDSRGRDGGEGGLDDVERLGEQRRRA